MTLNAQTITEGLNPSQKKAAECLNGPLLILAGAGSGKTKCLTVRTANLILQGEASPLEILAVTFTNKAAREMESRILGLLSDVGVPVYEQLWITTFHSGCAKILREYIHLLDYSRSFVIYDDSDQLSLIKKVLTKLNINEKTYPAKTFKNLINEAKMQALSPEEVDKKSYVMMDDRALSVYKTYEEEMKRANALDFGDLLFKTYDLFRSYPDVLEEYQNRFKYIMVDEYQDTNHIQYKIVKMLASKHKNICVVGDEDQSIYSWRGADITNILNFEKDFPGCETIKLEENYRSTKTIVEAASHVIANNSQRKDKTLFTNNESGSKIKVKEEMSEYDEARYVVGQIQNQVSSGGYTYKDCAIFYRTNAQSRVLEEQLRTNSVPYKLVGGVRFYERKEIKDILCYMRLLMNPADDVAAKRIINVPARGIGKTTVEKVERLGNENGATFYKALSMAAEQRIVHSGACKKLQNFCFMMDKIMEQSEELSLSETYHLLLEETQYLVKLREENTTESMARIDNLEEFNNAIAHFEQERGEEATLTTFLEEMALVSDADSVDDTDNGVTLMTLHISKGLEYPNVFIVGMEEGLFPGARAFDTSDETAIEEERRLAYVGMTRARQNLFLTHARSRRVWGQEQNHPPSRFINEIPDKYLEQKSAIKRPQFLSRNSSGYSRDSYSNYGGASRKPKNSYGGGDYSQSMPDYENFGDESYYNQSKSSGSQFQKGMMVRHPTFGVGSVFQVEGQGDQQKVSVVFSDHTTKKFVVKYARLEVV